MIHTRTPVAGVPAFRAALPQPAQRPTQNAAPVAPQAQPEAPASTPSIQFGGRRAARALAAAVLGLGIPLGLGATAGTAFAQPEPPISDQTESPSSTRPTTTTSRPDTDNRLGQEIDPEEFQQLREDVTALTERVDKVERTLEGYPGVLQQVRELVDREVPETTEAPQAPRREIQERLDRLQTAVDELRNNQQGFPKPADLTALRTQQDELKKSVQQLREAGFLTREQADAMVNPLNTRLNTLMADSGAATDAEDALVDKAKAATLSSGEWKLTTGLGALGALGLLLAGKNSWTARSLRKRLEALENPQQQDYAQYYEPYPPAGEYQAPTAQYPAQQGPAEQGPDTPPNA